MRSLGQVRHVGIAALSLLTSAPQIGCGKTEPAAPSHFEATPPEPTAAATEPTAVAPKVEPSRPRVDLEAEFHRTRVGPTGGFWVLGVIHNPHARPIADPRASVRLLDVEGELVGEFEGPVSRPLAADERAAAAVLVAEPIEHERLELSASGVLSDAEALPPLPLKLEYEPPQRAELGGYFVLGQVTNQSDATLEGVRLEIQGLDRSGKLLGLDWLALDPIPAGESIPFDIGGLRYEEVPAIFALELRRPAE